MSTQIAVRLPDEMVEFLDSAVAAGRARSRAEVVVAALEREIRARHAERDAQILTERGAGDDLDPLVQWSVRNLQPED